ncbi:MAG: hypothetical protein L0211_21355, partial [Planctomycetaceae bacterium]|nr:hypothetical protein [Planctomycetaceae bacterium]
PGCHTAQCPVVVSWPVHPYSSRKVRELHSAELNGCKWVLSMVNLSGSRGIWKIVIVERCWAPDIPFRSSALSDGCHE